MAVELDDFGPAQKRQYVLVGVTIGTVLAISSTVMRTWAKYISTSRIQAEDYFMGAALFLCIALASCLYYSLTTGLGQHEDTLTKPQIRNFLISLWVIQRLQSPSLFCIKTSLIIFYMRIFPKRSIWIAGWGIWIYTLLWLIGVWFATLFECHPISYFWNKTIEGGHCIPSPLITIGLTSAIISCLGDMFIFAMPIPVVLSLNINTRKKIALACVFAVGLFVITTSIVRWVALLGTKSDITWNQVEAGVWTYLEISIGITCANLPLLLPLVRSWFSTGDTSRGYRGAADKRSSAYTPNNMATPRSTTKKRSLYTGFTTLDASNNATLLGSEIELRDQDNGDQERGRPVSGDSVGASSCGLGPEVVSDDIGLPVDRQDRAIVVQTRVHIRYDEEDQRRIQEQRKHVALGGYGGDTKAYGTHPDGDDA
ncbi:hypothetical protein VPNG_09842 [Cytospora leucostoma]|uniref:Rhodopsin domain-containing protein n=1 Tax=Cytospora leucostoma TaxID=1230097 RepID=A0A423VIJ0_9PEZI|nr:hypothetical protein VPNG_09842 [Cytospora leucostoma]